MLIYIQSVIAIILGFISTITDIKDKKIYNIHILIAFLLSTLTYTIFWKQIEISYIKNFSVNIIISLFISFMFFYFKIWSAGDAKLFLAIIYMIPFEIYEASNENIFPGLYLLILMFSVAFIFIVFETFVLWVKDGQKFDEIKAINFNKERILDFLLDYFMGYCIINFFNIILYHFFDRFRQNNLGLLFLCNMLILLFIYRIVNEKMWKKIILGSFLIGIIFFYLTFGFNVEGINLKSMVIVLSIMLFRMFSEKYNYELIETDKLKPKMILSYGSVLLFRGSRVQGLPEKTDESTDYRLSEQEVNSIKRWSKTSRGKKEITIVRYIPFAPFMFVGQLVFWIIKLYL